MRQPSLTTSHLWAYHTLRSAVRVARQQGRLVHVYSEESEERSEDSGSNARELVLQFTEVLAQYFEGLVVSCADILLEQGVAREAFWDDRERVVLSGVRSSPEQVERLVCDYLSFVLQPWLGRQAGSGPTSPSR